MPNEERWRPYMRIDVAISLGLAIVTVGGWVLGAIQDVPWLHRIVAILLMICALSYLWDRFGARCKSLLGIQQEYAPIAANLRTTTRKQEHAKDFVSAHFCSGSQEWRLETLEHDGKKWVVVKIAVHNSTEKSVKKVTVFLQSRTWSEGNKLRIYKDSSPLTMSMPGDGTMHPSLGVSFVLVSQNIAAPDEILLGDPSDAESEREVISAGTHFITVAVLGEDQKPAYKNFVVVTSPKVARPYALEFDKRRWGSFVHSPNPYQPPPTNEF